MSTTGQEGRTGPGGLVGLGVSSPDTVALISLGDDAAVVIDTAADSDSGRQVVATWIVEGERREAIDAERAPLVLPRAWSAGDDVYVFGTECPEVAIDLVSDFDEHPVERVCGAATARTVIRHLDTVSATWREVAEAPVSETGTSFLLAGSAEQALIRAGVDAVSTIDLASGEVTPLPEALFRDIGFERACALHDGAFLVVSTASGAPGVPGPDAAERPLSVWLVRDGRSAPLDGPDSLPVETFGPADCLPGRGVLGLVTEDGIDALTLDARGALAHEHLDLPEGIDHDDLRLQSAPPHLLLWVLEGQVLVPWRWVDGGPWTRIDAVHPSLDPPMQSLVVDGRVIAVAVTAYEDPISEDALPVPVTEVVEI